MKFKRIAFLTLLSATIFLGFTYVMPNLNGIQAETTQSSATTSQGEIVVNYVDQNGNTLRPATTVMGKSGSTYTAAIPNIPGYTYSKIENGENDNYGPQMVFGGGDNVTNVLQMVIVYKNTGSTSSSNKEVNSSANNTATKNANSSVTNNTNKNTNTNSKNIGSNSTASKVNKNATSKSANSNADGSNDASKNDSNKVNNDSKDSKSNHNNSKPEKTDSKKSNKPKKQAKTNQSDDSKKAEKSNKNSSLGWIVSGIVLLIAAIGVFTWYKMKPGSHFKR
ncbi:MucBP domain-containing protein [Fructilactobacillus sp. Tb1]|uniref:MucBP domain-containing protein n=1 Tax=Fructilactobacillus sp. Tb1 TaxID=3422304 RepID=UPI003D2DAEB8